MPQVTERISLLLGTCFPPQEARGKEGSVFSTSMLPDQKCAKLPPIQYTYQGSNSNNIEPPNEPSSRGSRDDLSDAPQERQFVGFCNPQDQEMDMSNTATTTTTITNRRKKHKDRKVFLPEVLKDDDDVDLRQFRTAAAGGGAQSNLVNSESATFAYPEINEPIRSSSPSYGALE